MESAVRISAPYKFVSKEIRKRKNADQGEWRRVIGGDEFVVMAGPCSVEIEKQIMRDGGGRRAAGARFCAAARSSRELRRTIFRGWKKKA